MSARDTSLNPAARSNVNSWWGAATVDVLWALGVRTVVLSPGSRSTPLTFACAAHGKMDTRVVLDERSAAFFALGIAKARHETVALVCTSGSAVANYLPAVVEAAESGVPLLLLTADRPVELRYRHAGQTIDQVKIFGGAVRLFAEAPLPEPRLEILAAWRDLLTQAVTRTTSGHPGPVHLNCPFREPLSPGTQVDPSLPIILAHFTENVATIPIRRRLDLPASLPRAGWIVAGPVSPKDPEAYVSAVTDLSRALGWPILADALNPCRHFADTGCEHVISAYDCLLRNPETRDQVRPEGVLQLGELPTSKVLRETLASWQLPTWIVDPAPDSRNAVAAPATYVSCLVEELSIGSNRDLSSVPIATQHLLAANRAACTQLEAALGATTAWIEPRIARSLIEETPDETPIYVASSMPVRDAEYFWSANLGRRPIFFNRGANGIDGTLSTALGVAEGLGRSTVLYTSDLALLHDTNGLLIASTTFTGSLTIVCINNAGGGIFEHLPIAAHGDLFERCFATPQHVDFARWAAAYGINYQQLEHPEDLAAALRTLPASGVRLLEIRTDRKRDAAWRKKTFAEASASGTRP